MQTPETFVHRRRGGLQAMIAIALFIPAMFIAAVVDWGFDVPEGPFPAAVIVTAAVVAYFVFGSEHRVVLDDRGMRFSRVSILFGVRRAERVLWEIAASELTSAREVTTRTPSSRGGWNTTVVLHFPGDRKIAEGEIGVRGAPSSPYDALVASLRRRLGERFTVEQIT